MIRLVFTGLYGAGITALTLRTPLWSYLSDALRDTSATIRVFSERASAAENDTVMQALMYSCGRKILLASFRVFLVSVLLLGASIAPYLLFKPIGTERPYHLVALAVGSIACVVLKIRHPSA